MKQSEQFQHFQKRMNENPPEIGVNGTLDQIPSNTGELEYWKARCKAAEAYILLEENNLNKKSKSYRTWMRLVKRESI